MRHQKYRVKLGFCHHGVVGAEFRTRGSRAKISFFWFCHHRVVGSQISGFDGTDLCVMGQWDEAKFLWFSGEKVLSELG